MDKPNDPRTPPAAHTPGPWRVETGPTQVGHYHQIQPVGACLYVDGSRVAEGGYKSRTAAADARLIAAAPAMLAALERFMILAEHMDFVADNMEARGAGSTRVEKGLKEAARAAITKAKEAAS